MWNLMWHSSIDFGPKIKFSRVNTAFATRSVVRWKIWWLYVKLGSHRAIKKLIQLRAFHYYEMERTIHGTLLINTVKTTWCSIVNSKLSSVKINGIVCLERSPKTKTIFNLKHWLNWHGRIGDMSSESEPVYLSSHNAVPRLVAIVSWFCWPFLLTFQK